MTKRYFSESSPSSSPNNPDKNLNDILSGLKKDDLIILGIVLILLGEGCRDKELLITLGFLFLSDKPGILNNLL
ncbi:MAG: hypothetical protein Q4G23_02655 [Clostridia bacterium]|nr:hypothetical protein [Clostridia bacterium]